MTILIPQDIHQSGKAFLQKRGYELRPGTGHDEATLIGEVAEADALILRTAVITRAVIEAAPKLQIIAKHGVGVDNVDFAAANEAGIWVTNCPLANASTVAEAAIGMMIALARKLLPSAPLMREGRYDERNQMTGSDLAGKTLGIVGMGRIGKSLAKKAHFGLEMPVLGFDPQAQDVPHWVEMVPELSILLGRSDFVSLHLPLLPATHHLIGERELAQMRPGAFLLNLARGGIVDESALFDALQIGEIAGAALDVFEQEPPPRDHPLLHHPSVISTPHNVSLTHEALQRMAQHAAQSCDEVLQGNAPSWPVNQPQQPRNGA